MLQNIPIQRKLMRVILLICGVVLFVTCAGFFAYEFFTFRQTTVQKLSTLGEVIATNSTAALAFDNRDDAKEILMALKAEPHIVVASIYNENGDLFAQYPETALLTSLPGKPGQEGYRFKDAALEGFQPIVQGKKQLGTLFIRSDLKAINERFLLYGLIALLVIAISVILTYLLSRLLQKIILTPILSLAETAKAISDRRDYSVRAAKFGDDELGLLTDAFNHMLQEIQEQNGTLIEREERYRTLIERVSDGFIALDKNWNYVYANKQAGEITGRDPSLLIGKNVWEEFPDAVGTETYKAFTQAMADQQYICNTDHYEPLNLWQENHIYPSPNGLSVFIRNITERKLAEQKINDLNQHLEEKVIERTTQLETVNKELEAFSYSVSHDLRAPLRAVTGYAQILNEEYGPNIGQEGKRLIGTIQYNAEKMGRLIDDLLSFSRLGRKEIQKSEISMNELVEALLRDLNKTTTYKTQINFDKLHKTKADYGLIYQVMFNLVSNAIKYSSKNEHPIVEIKSKQENEETIFSVKDNGAGFDMRYMKKLFGVFQRLHSNEEFEGTGVGLAIVQRIIAKHGGKVWAEGEVNKGATFYFSLPTSQVSIPI